jgi:hypothetical protein
MARATVALALVAMLAFVVSSGESIFGCKSDPATNFGAPAAPYPVRRVTARITR